MGEQVLRNESSPAPLAVAVIGAGFSGISSAAHLLKHGLRVTVFERSNVSGGIWLHDDRISHDPTYPSETPSVGDYEPTTPGQFASGRMMDDSKQQPNPLFTKDDDALEIAFAPPGSCYEGLTNNIPTTVMVSSLRPWPEGTKETIEHRDIKNYVQGLASDHGVNDVTEFNTRVEEVRKSPDGKTWTIRTIRLLERGAQPQRVVEKTRQFDAVVVASGFHNQVRVPDMPGLKEWKAKFGGRVMHSKQYRNPKFGQGKNIFIIGCGISSMDICLELKDLANCIYQSSRGGAQDIPVRLLPANARRVGAVQRFETFDGYLSEGSLEDSAPIPGRIVLKDGEVIENVHHVILATGYLTSLPFLPYLHQDDTPAQDAGTRTLVTADGDMTHNLHKDIFYIEDPTLLVVGRSTWSITFSCFDFQAQVVARVLAGKAQLPSREAMRSEYEHRLEEKGLGRGFHSVRNVEDQYVRGLVEWMNRDAKESGAEAMKGHSEEWLGHFEALKERVRALLTGEPGQKWPGTD